MTEDPRHHSELFVLLEAQSCRAMPQVVESLTGKSGGHQSCVEPVRHVGGIERLPEWCREHEISIAPPRTGRETLLDLPPTMIAEALC